MQNKKAMLFGFMLGDGWVSRTHNNTYNHHASGFSGDESSLRVAKSDLIEVYGDIGKATINTRSTSSPGYNIEGTTSSFAVNTVVSKDMIKLGMPVGKKVEKEFLLPEWVVSGDKDIKTAFMSGLYAAEGYTPAMQKNDKTLKTLGLNMSKRYRLKDNFSIFISQLSEILTDLDIEHNIKSTIVQTCDKNIKTELIFKNNIGNILSATNTLDLRYCVEKNIEFETVKKYYELRVDTLANLQVAYDDALSSNSTSKEIAQKHGLTTGQISGWRDRKTGFRIPNNFPTYSDFKIAYCSL